MTDSQGFILKIITTPAEIERAKAFAAESVSSSVDYYAKTRNQGGPKVQQDIMYGRLAEIAIHKAITERGVKCSEPDWKVYAAKEKRHSPDLLFSDENHRIAVKSITEASAVKYTRSWTFQRRDPLTWDLQKAHGFLALTSIALDNSVLLWHFIPAKLAIGRYKPMVLPQLASKWALYDADFETDASYWHGIESV